MIIDLHTHTNFSYDASTTFAEIKALTSSGSVQIAITDHDEINFAKKAFNILGPEKIIIGEEVTTKDGKHIIGLFLKSFVPKGLEFIRTAELIRAQGGLVYIPHPLEPRYGLGEEKVRVLSQLGLIDIIEVFNGWVKFSLANLYARKVQNDRALELAQELNIAAGAGSDSHSIDTYANAGIIANAPVLNQNELIEITKQNTQTSEKEKLMLKMEYNMFSLRAFKAVRKMFLSRFGYRPEHSFGQFA